MPKLKKFQTFYNFYKHKTNGFITKDKILTEASIPIESQPLKIKLTTSLKDMILSKH